MIIHLDYKGSSVTRVETASYKNKFENLYTSILKKPL